MGASVSFGSPHLQRRGLPRRVSLLQPQSLRMLHGVPLPLPLRCPMSLIRRRRQGSHTPLLPPLLPLPPLFWTDGQLDASIAAEAALLRQRQLPLPLWWVCRAGA